MDNNRKALKSGIWYTISSFLMKSIGFLTTPIFTRLLTKSDFGLYNNFTSWLSIITIFVTLNLEASLISARFDFEEEFDSYILSVLGLGALSSGLWFLILQLFMEPISVYTHVEPTYLNIMMVYLLFSPAVQLFVARERYLFRYKASVLISIVITITTALFSVALVIGLNNKLFGRIIGSVIPTVIMGLFLFVFFINKGKKIQIKHWRYAIPICLPYIPHLLAGSLLNSMDRVMIERFCGSEDTAVYSLAYTCGTLVTLFIVALNSAFAPWLGEKLHEQKYEDIRKVSLPYIGIFMVFAFGIMLIAPDVLFLLGGEAYLEAKYVITPVAMGCVCQFLYTLYVNIEQIKKKTVGMAIATVIAALINLVLNYIFIPKIGYLAAAYTTLIGFLSLLIMHIILVKHLGLGDVYNFKIVLAAIIFGIVGMVIVTFSYNYLIIRSFLICIYCLLVSILVYKYRKVIKEFVRKKKV